MPKILIAPQWQSNEDQTALESIQTDLLEEVYIH